MFGDATPPSTGGGDGPGAEPAARPKEVWEQVLDELRLQIVLGELAPGSRLIETELSHGFGVSRGPVRTALLHLEQSGLVVASNRRGVEVARLSSADIGDLFDVRAALERLAAPAAARCGDPTLIARLRAHLGVLRVARKAGHPVEAAEADLAFHEAICEASGNRVLCSAWLNLADRMALVVTRLYQGSAELLATDTHGAIVDALEAGDPEAAEESVRLHFAGAAPRHQLLSDAASAPLVE